MTELEQVGAKVDGPDTIAKGGAVQVGWGRVELSESTAPSPSTSPTHPRQTGTVPCHHIKAHIPVTATTLPIRHPWTGRVGLSEALSHAARSPVVQVVVRTTGVSGRPERVVDGRAVSGVACRRRSTHCRSYS